MKDGWHVTARCITQWTNTNRREAQGILPLLVRKLLLASINPSLLSFRSGDSISVSGWDGILKADQGNAFCPAGDSVWEIGTSKRIEKKANEDYQKRTRNPLGVDKKKSTFVFVTSQPWAKRDNWVKEKDSEKEWAQVRGLNADDLEAWLEQCPAVHRWFARLIGKRPEGAWDIEQAWNIWSCGTQPACNADLVIAGRQDQAKELVSKLKVGPSAIRVLSESSEEEAYAFTLAAIKECVEFSPRILVVKEPKELDILIDSQQPLILIPQFYNGRSLGFAVQRGHWVILPISYAQLGGRQADITLGRADLNQEIKALTAMGLKDDKAEEIVHFCRGFLNAIRRHPVLAIDYQKPDWATSQNAGTIIIALLAGAWRVDNKNDRDKLAQLADIPYNEFEQALHRWRIASDAPIRLVGNIWQIKSRQDAWLQLSPFINISVLKKFGEVAKEVLQEIDPRFELPPEERWLANVRGKVTKHSDLLRHGLAEMLAMLASYGDKDCQGIGTHSLQDLVSLWVRQLLIEDISGQRWGSLARELPLLAEAAPEVFMEAVEIGLQGRNPPVMELFVDEGDLGRCMHSGLLWALEGISWNPQYVASAVRILAKLARLDPGGRYLNRPSKTLREIFQGWLPQTKATLNERLEIIDSLMLSEPEPGWKLLLDLLPERGGGISTLIHRPVFRAWDEGWKKGATHAEYYQHIVAIAERILKHVDEEPNTRWLDVVKELPQLPKESFDKVIVQLRSVLSKLAGAVVNEIHNELREIISRHSEFSDSEWALPKESIDQLDGIYQSSIPEDLVTRYRFLFDNPLPNLSHPTPRLDYEQRQKLVDKARTDALEEIWGTLQATGVIRLATSVKFPWSLGNSLAITSFADRIEGLVLDWLNSKNISLVQIAQAYIYARYRQKHEWLTFIREKYAEVWSGEIWAVFSLSLPFGKKVFDFLETSTESIRKKYWENIRGYYLQDEDAECANWVIEQLLKYKRPFAAINAAAQYLNTIVQKRGLDGDTLARTLELAATDPADLETAPSMTFNHDIVEVLKALQSDLINEKRLARIEWMYMQIIHQEEIKPRALLKEIIQNPSFFVHLICLMFRGDPPVEGEFSKLPPESIKMQAQNARCLLESVNQLPGQNGAQISASQLQEWIDKAREECTQRNRRVIGDECIGKLLSHSPSGSDMIWPHEAIRDALERYESGDIESGLEVGLYNQRGVTSRPLGAGGKQERELAEKYQQQADKIKYRWPRTAAMLRSISATFQREAAMFDRSDQLQGEITGVF